MGVQDFFKAHGSTNTPNPAENGDDIRQTVPWVEKYRPKKVDELVYQDEVVSVLKKCIAGADLPNLLFYGPPGTGKTSAAVALCHQLFPTAVLYKNRVLEMNASDERGIDVVRHRIKEFSHLAVGHSDGVSAAGKKKKSALLALKVVILDEADAMTSPAQAALRRTMESESHSTRFFLICNYVTRIIDPLTSRCAKFRFKPLSVDAQRQRLKQVCAGENVQIEEAAIDALVDISAGDLRKSITLLQSLASAVVGNAFTDDAISISASDVRELSGYVPPADIDTLLAAAQSDGLRQMACCVRAFCRKGFSAYQVITQLADLVLANDALEPRHKAVVFEKLAVCESRLLDGADEYLQLFDLLAVMQKCFYELDI